MTPAAESLVRALAEHVSRSSEVRLLVAMARAALLAEGVLPPPASEPAGDQRRPKTGAERTAAWKRKRRQQVTAGDAPSDAGDEAGDVTGDAPGDAPAPPGPPRDRDSHALEIPEERESETRARAAPVTGPVTHSVTSPVTASVTSEIGERYVTVTDALPSLLREAAAMVPVKDIDGAWKKFTGHYAGKFLHVQGAWQKWCVNEAKRERIDAERQRDREAAAGTGTKHDGPVAKAERARRNRELRDAEANRSPIPTADLMAAIGRPPPKEGAA